MNKSINEIEKELLKLNQQKQELEERLLSAIQKAIHKVASQKETKRLDKHTFVVNFSDLIGNPLSPLFYDWEASEQIIMAFLREKPVAERKSLLQAKLTESKHGKPVTFTGKISKFGYKDVTNIPVSRDFLAEIIENL